MKRLATVAPLLILGALAVSRTSLASCVDYGDRLRWIAGVTTAGPAGRVTVSGNHAYVAEFEAGLQIIHISNPHHPTVAWTVDTPGLACAAAVSGSHAYVADYDHGLQVIQLWGGIVGSLAVTGYAVDVAVAGSRAYVLDTNLNVVDVSDPRHPFMIGSVDLPGSGAWGLAVSESCVLTASGDGLHVVDVGDPGNPRVVGSVACSAFAVATSGPYAYVAGEGLVQVIDISDPTAPQIVGSVPSAGLCVSISVSGDRACVTGCDPIRGLELQVIDVSDPQNPQTLGSIRPFVMDLWEVEIAGDFALVGAGGTGLVVIDITNPQGPPDAVGFVPCNALNVTVADVYAYVGAEQGLHVVDVTDTGNPRIVGTAVLPGHAHAGNVAVSGTYAYVAVGTWHPDDLQIVDVAKPESPTVVGSVATPGAVYDVAIQGRYAYLTDYDHGLAVLDILDPEAPAIVGGVSTPGLAISVAVEGTKAYVAGGSSRRFVVVDVTDPADPRVMGSLVAPGSSAVDVTVSGTYAYLANSDRGLQVIDVADPGNPRIVGSAALPWRSTEVVVKGGYAYVSDWGLQVLDIHDPLAPRILSGTGPAHGDGVGISDDFVYLADCDDGLSIFPRQCDLSTAVADGRSAAGVPALRVFPNPVSHQTTIRLSLAAEGSVVAAIYDVSGRKVRGLRCGSLAAGVHDLLWNGRDDANHEVASGLYLARVSTPEGTRMARIAWVK